MNRKTAKLIRGLTKLTGRSYRAFKKAFYALPHTERAELRRQLQKFWDDNERQGLLNHKKYYDLKKPLKESVKVPTESV